MDKKMTFEEANGLLDETVKKMENKSLPLSESVALYAQACDLLAFCMKELDSYKGQITDLHEQLLKVAKKENAGIED